MTDIAWIHQVAYDQGKDPVEHAVEHVAMFVELAEVIRADRVTDPDSFPGYGPDVSFDHFARRIVGGLLDAGWTLPAVSS